MFVEKQNRVYLITTAGNNIYVVDALLHAKCCIVLFVVTFNVATTDCRETENPYLLCSFLYQQPELTNVTSPMSINVSQYFEIK